VLLTGINLTTKAQNVLANPGSDNGAVLRFVADDVLLTLFDMLARNLAPRARNATQRLKLVTCRAKSALAVSTSGAQ